MKTLSEEIRDFLAATGKTQSELARAAEVPQSTVSTLISGIRPNVRWQTADALRTAMNRLSGKPAGE